MYYIHVKTFVSYVISAIYFNDHIQRYSDYVSVYTDGLKSDGHVGMTVVFPDFRFFTLYALSPHLNSMHST